MARRLLVLLVLTAGVAASALAARAPLPRFEVLGHADPRIAYAADVYGHRGYAYLSSHRGRRSCPADGVLVYGLRDPRRPRLVSRFAQVAGTWTEKTIVRRVRTASFEGDVAVTSFQACEESAFRGFGLYDVTDPRRPRELARVRTEPRGSHEIWLAAVGGRAYVYTAILLSELRSAPDFDPAAQTATAPGAADFRIFDVSDPAQPREIGSWGAWRELGIPPTAVAGRANLVHSVITNAAATRAYLSYWDLGTVVLDISAPERPRYLGRTGRDGNTHSAAVSPDERLLIETHETGGGRPTLFDVSNPERPVYLSAFTLPPSASAEGRRGVRTGGSALFDSVHDPKLSGPTAFFSWYGQGVVAADVSNPRRPRFLARFLPTTTRDREQLFCPGSACRAVWGVHVTPSYVLASDMLGGLWVLRFTR